MKQIRYLFLFISFFCSAQHNYLEEGNLLIAKKKDKKAERVFREAIKSDPTNLVLQAQLGLTLVNQGKYQEAENQLNDVLKLDSKNVAALWYAGINNFVNGEKYRKSLDYFETVYSLVKETSSQYSLLNFFIGKSYTNLFYTEGLTYNEISRMLETLKEYVRLQPNASDADNFKAFINDVEKVKPSPNVKKWKMLKSEKDTGEIIAKELDRK